MERVTIIIDARDRFSTTTKCLQTLIDNTPQPYDLVVVMGGAPEHLKEEWLVKFGDKNSTFIFRPEFLNQAQARNIGLRKAKTRLAVVMDSDNYVHPGWLEALISCQNETGAVLVVPVILEPPRRIHTAGNDIYLTYEGGETRGYKHLRYHGMVYGDGANMKRQQTDYAELHCQLVEVEPTLKLDAYDEKILEVGEVDQGLTYSKAGHSMVFEPSSVVTYALGCAMTVDDIKLFSWRWNIKNVHDGYQHFHKKWNIDISEFGTFRDWLVRYNSQLGLLPRFWPNAFCLKLDKFIGRLNRRIIELLRAPKYRFQRLNKHVLGYYHWTIGVSR